MKVAKSKHQILLYRLGCVAAEKEAADIYVIKTNEIVPNMS